MRYRVTALHVTARSAEAAELLPPGWKQELCVTNYSQGAILPESVPRADLDHLLRLGMIEPVG
jgi:hypothetical protein